MEDDYKFYMSRYDKGLGSWEEEIELTEKFEGLLYCKCEGISSKGKVKNIYTESYAESEELRIYLPENPVRESTEINLCVVFVEDTRRDVLDSFVEYVTGKLIRYWDTVRNRIVYMIQTDEIKPEEDIIIGSTPYIYVEIPFKNIKGQTEKKV